MDELYCEMINCAVRYGLGRATYVVDDICKYVKDNMTSLSDKSIKTIIRDINTKSKDKFFTDEPLGPLDIKIKWFSLKADLEYELLTRKRIGVNK